MTIHVHSLRYLVFRVTQEALHHLGWQAAWGFEDTVRETALWYKHFYEKPTESIADFS